MRHARWLAGGLVLLGVSACDITSRDSGPVVEVRDSAGVRIVEYSRFPDDISTWSVSPVPETRLELGAGRMPTGYGTIRSVTRRASGEIVVADAMSRELKGFDPETGQHLWTAGGRGWGAGRFQTLTQVFVMEDDSLAASDGERLVSVFDPANRFARRLRLAPPPAGYWGTEVVGVTTDGAIIAAVQEEERLPDSSSPPGIHLVPVVLVFYDGAGQVVGEAGPFPGFEAGVALNPDGQGYFYAPPVRRRMEYAVAAEGIWVTDQRSFQVHRYGSDGKLLGVVRVMQPPIPVDHDLVERARYDDFDLYLKLGPMLIDTFPAIGLIHVDGKSRLWVEDYVPPYEEREPVWRVFDSDGYAVAAVTVPRQLAIQHIDVETVIGVARDDDGREYVQIHRIIRREN